MNTYRGLVCNKKHWIRCSLIHEQKLSFLGANYVVVLRLSLKMMKQHMNNKDCMDAQLKLLKEFMYFFNFKEKSSPPHTPTTKCFDFITHRNCRYNFPTFAAKVNPISLDWSCNHVAFYFTRLSVLFQNSERGRRAFLIGSNAELISSVSSDVCRERTFLIKILSLNFQSIEQNISQR